MKKISKSRRERVQVVINEMRLQGVTPQMVLSYVLYVMRTEWKWGAPLRRKILNMLKAGQL